MRLICFALALAGLLPLAAAQTRPAYQQPSAAIREVLDTPALPRLLPSPERSQLAIIEQARYPALADLARPQLRLAGLRFDPRSATPIGLVGIERLRLRALRQADAPERSVTLPKPGLWHSFVWAPDGQRFVLERRLDQANELWVGDTASATLQRVPKVNINNVLADGEQAWLNPEEVVVLSIPQRRSAAPHASVAPMVQESLGRNSPERTHADLLRSVQDEALFEFHAQSQMLRVNLRSLRTQALGSPGLYHSLTTVGEGQGVLSERLVRPFSYTLIWSDFPSVVELWSPEGKRLRELARTPLRQGVAIDGVIPGPRQFFASPHKDAALYWVEALDGGNPAQRAAFRDRLMRLDPPYQGEAYEVQRMPYRFARLRFADDGQHALLSEEDRSRAWTRSYWLPLRGTQSRMLFEHAVRERYRHPGSPLLRTLPNGRLVAQTQQGDLLMVGPGANPRGERPFLDRMSVRDGSTARLFQSAEQAYEMPLAWSEDRRLLTLRETATEPPNLVLREGAQAQALTRISDNQPRLRKLRRELVTFKRADGVELSFWLVLPPDYRDGEHRPTLVWAYPMEFNDATLASQLAATGNRYQPVSGINPQLLALDGYVVLMDATMPVVGDLRAVSDGFIEQLMMNARAILDKAEDLGVTDPRRVAVGGHSYGAFMATNLLAHTKLFRCGIARSGAYNRTLTPFGFQSERRSLWDAKETYLRVSPFLYAHQIKEPLLLIHGEYDNNPGTFPMQSERLYQALAGTGGSARYVQLPFEGHGYQARESVGHVQWEMSQWLRSCLREPKN
ncbi:alpha/beta hydrolase family protein [Roseateles sp. BYS180W]|uniref:Alpha/beta hydrolase family protein n=1 Tax=Roseateles rivi TaxID=3299028 RepID=A0ABW7FQZ6_9BURK